MNTPMISIVMPSYNQGQYLREAIESVLDQSYPNKELIVIDGGSKDDSADIISSYDKQLAYWVSEPDSGQSEAFNKGFSRCKGRFMTWVNSDDILLPGALEAIAAAASQYPKLSWFTGNTARIDADSKVIRCTKNEGWHSWLVKLGGLYTYCPSTFYTQEMYDEAGGLDEKFHIMMDTDMWWRFYKAGHRFHRVDAYLYGFRVHEESKTTGPTMANSELADESHPIRIRTNEEYALMEHRHGIKEYGLMQFVRTWAARSMRVAGGSHLAGWRDTKKFRGKHWSECFKD